MTDTAAAARFYDYINGRDVDRWADYFSNGWRAVPALPEQPDQLAGYRAVIDQFREGAPDLHVETLELIANDDVVAVRSRVSGTHSGELFGHAATGKPFAFTAMDIHRIADGRIMETWHVEDFAALINQITN